MRLLKISRPVDTRHLIFSGGALAFLDSGDHDAMILAARRMAEDLISNPKHLRAPVAQGWGEAVAMEGGPRFVLLRGSMMRGTGRTWRWLTGTEDSGTPYVAVTTFQEANLELGSTGSVLLEVVEDAEEPVSQ